MEAFPFTHGDVKENSDYQEDEKSIFLIEEISAFSTKADKSINKIKSDIFNLRIQIVKKGLCRVIDKANEKV